MCVAYSPTNGALVGRPFGMPVKEENIGSCSMTAKEIQDHCGHVVYKVSPLNTAYLSSHVCYTKGGHQEIDSNEFANHSLNI